MRLWVLGNGFDLAHEMPTSYWDYHQYLITKGEKTERQGCHTYDVPVYFCREQVL